MKYEIIRTRTFDKWFASLKDRQAVLKINIRLLRLEQGHFGDCKSIGSSVSELRIFVGKGYRIYYTIRNNQVVLLLCGGHKDTQSRDIKKAQQILQSLE